MTPPATDTLDIWLQRGLASGELRAADVAFARMAQRLCPDAPLATCLASAVVSRHAADGHIAWPIDSTAATGGPCRAWLQRLLAHAPHAADHPHWLGDGSAATPLVRHGPRLYLWRHWQREQAVARALAARLQPAQAPAPDQARAWLDALFGPAANAPDADQRWACACALRQALTVITGGPGTGKTTTVARLLATLQGLALAQGAPLTIALAAPTGKAAARLAAALSQAWPSLPPAGLPVPTDVLRRHLPSTARTLHALLGQRPDGGAARHGPDQPLPLDVLVIDEASMVDLELLHTTVLALPPQARLILLGDRDQLASVQAGAVLAELCLHADAARWRPSTAQALHAATGVPVPAEWTDPGGDPLDQAVVMLRRSRRFDADSGIGRWAQAVRQGDVDAVRHLLRHPSPDVSVHSSADDDRWLATWTAHAHALLRPLADALPDAADVDAWTQQRLAQHGRLQVLCALRQGPWGVEGLNARLQRRAEATAPTLPQGPWGPAGQPWLITRNQPALGVMNGDLGLLLPRRAPGGGLQWRLALPGAQASGVQWVLPAQLGHKELAWAMTVHKAQGSEFDHVILVLPPDPDSPLATRELLYTGITRARQRLSLVLPGGPDTLLAALQRRTERDSGLRDAVLAALP
ncbi:MAG: exodeoxyribonuclease V subunit alpha [Tepidimonas ignava]|nr:exodeoxyribonuclease V subunit alpha [Tepidimonas ignava]